MTRPRFLTALKIVKSVQTTKQIPSHHHVKKWSESGEESAPLFVNLSSLSDFTNVVISLSVSLFSFRLQVRMERVSEQGLLTFTLP